MKIAIIVVMIGFLGLIGYFLLVDSNPLKTIVVDDLSQPLTLELTADYNPYGIELTYEGEIHGRAQITVCYSDTNCYKQDTIVGNMTGKINGDWYTPSCIVKITPLEKSTGIIRLHYRFFGT